MEQSRLVIRAYKIKRGDTVCSIAREFNISIISLLKVNQHKNPKQLTIGDTLAVPTEDSDSA
ncbi:LysM peptidoglycan-binding domain-containing protein [Robertmurraya kyonggiensis]|uniref:LysM peptidoglycan-binding domain-containing protein n=1 Tax=Robertmurraya kyonggiensis TaxID=1037680 RepID=UPI00130D9546|nr:LysM domain-containing protein [Robertmurraya kyonggiensis]